MSYNTSDSAFRQVIVRICERIDSPAAKALSSSIVSDEPMAKWMPSLQTINVESFSADYFLSKILSKWKGWKQGKVNTKASALIGWYADEAENSKTNKRIRGLIQGTGYPGSDIIAIISRAQYHVESVLGTFRLSKVLSSCRWGPGATWDYSRGTTRDTKLSSVMSVTREAMPFMKLLIEGDPNWGEAITGFYPSGPFSVVKDFWKYTDSSRFSTVPKDWDKDRCIDMQPTANGYLQQGVGQYIRHRLKSKGIDLNSQEENQLGAFYAFYADLATVDLQSASDSVTKELVSLLVPSDWCQYLFSLRTRYTEFGRGGTKVETEKFSAMGNAFTFELETLIFWAISLACSELEGVKDSLVLVYGDDIVIHRNVYDRLISALTYLGFRVNEGKSFRSGPFFESCGRHYFLGNDVTPIYQKNLVSSPEECIRFHNRLVRWSVRIYGDPWYFSEALVLLRALYYDVSRNKFLEARRPPEIPLTTEGDDGFLSDEECFERDINGGFWAFVYRRQKHSVSHHLKHEAYLQLKLNDRHFSNGDPRGYPYEDSGRGRYRLSRVYFYR
jgi:hypothetical protein